MPNDVELAGANLEMRLARHGEANASAERWLARDFSRLQGWHEEANYAASDDESADDRAELDETFAFYASEIQFELPQVFRAALLVATYAAFEHYMHSVAVAYQRKLGAIPVADIRGEGIERARLYIKKVGGQQFFPDQVSEWRFLSNTGIVRNALTHRGRNIAGWGNNEDRVRAFAARAPELLEVNATGDIMLSGLAVSTFIGNANTFVAQVSRHLTF